MHISRFLLTLLFGTLLVPLRADVVLDVRFDGSIDADSSGGPSNNDPITGVINGKIDSTTGLPLSVMKGANTSVATTTPLGNGGYLSAVGGDSAQGAFIVPAGPTNALVVLTPKVGTQRVLQGGFDFFIRSGVQVRAGADTDQIRMIDSDAGRTDNLRLIVNNSAGANTALRVSIDNRNATEAGAPNCSLIVAAPPSFVIEANVTYHFGVIYENDGIGGNSTGYLFGVAGTGAMDTTNRTASNPAYLATASVNFGPDVLPEFGGLTSAGFSFGRLNQRSDGDTQEWDRFRLYNTAPTRFPAASEPVPVVRFDLTAGVAKIRFSTDLQLTYRVDKSDDLSNPTGWIPLANNIAGTGVDVEVTDPTANSVSGRFYRVVVLAPPAPGAPSSLTRKVVVVPTAPVSLKPATSVKPLPAVSVATRPGVVARPSSAKPLPAPPSPARR